ncbi:MAG TPA: hypothetical protein VF212_13915 [Longimicrobiales bacterium]
MRADQGPVIEFRFAHATPGPNLVPMTGPAGKIHLEERNILTDAQIERARAYRRPGQFAVEIELTPEGAPRLQRESRARIGSRYVLLIDSRRIADGVVTGELGATMIVAADVADLPAGAAEEMAEVIAARWLDPK